MKRVLLLLVVTLAYSYAFSQLVIDFESGGVPAEVTGVVLQNGTDEGDSYDGIVDNPFQTAENPSLKVAKVTLAGSTDLETDIRKAFTSLKFTFATPVDFSSTDKKISAKIYKTASYGDVALRLLKAPGGTANALTHEDSLAVVPGVWTTVEWDLTGTIVDGLSSGSVLIWPDAFEVGENRNGDVVVYIDDVKIPYENPATGIEDDKMSTVNVIVTNSELTVIGTSEVDQMEIYGLSGQMVHKVTGSKKANISQLSSGVHILVVKIGNETKTFKFVK